MTDFKRFLYFIAIPSNFIEFCDLLNHFYLDNLSKIIKDIGQYGGDFIYSSMSGFFLGKTASILSTLFLVSMEISNIIPYQTSDKKDIPAAILGGVIGYYTAYLNKKKDNKRYTLDVLVSNIYNKIYSKNKKIHKNEKNLYIKKVL